MSTSTFETYAAADTSCLAIATLGAHPSAGIAESLAQSLRRWFQADFAILSVETGETLFAPSDLPLNDFSSLAELCRAAGRSGQPEIVDEREPLFALAIPQQGLDGEPLVALGVFTSRSLNWEKDQAAIAEFFGASPEVARRWAVKQPPLPVEAARRTAQLLVAKERSERQVDDLKADVEKLSLHVGTTLEEISLIYRLTQNLKLSRGEQELCSLALEWLFETMPFGGLAIQLLQGRPNDKNARDDRNPGGPSLLAKGDCPFDNDGLARLVEHFQLSQAPRTVVVNGAVSRRDDWPFAEVRELIVVPIGEGERLFGWLAAFNHADGGEFGTVEADLLASVSAILGIHGSNANLYRQQRELLSGIVRALTSAIDAKDPYTCGHSDRVARVSVRLAQELGCSQQEQETIYLSGLLHDVGKIGIDDNVLRKPGRLTPPEFEHIKTHARIGHNILLDLKQLEQVLPAVLHHHESWDGSGYPNGLAGEAIPELARIVAVADAFDAMGSDRPYRRGMPDDRLDEVIKNGAGRQWDPRVAAAFFAARDDIREIARRQSEDDCSDLRHFL